MGKTGANVGFVRFLKEGGKKTRAGAVPILLMHEEVLAKLGE
jgi:hypothetical protein